MRIFGDNFRMGMTQTFFLGFIKRSKVCIPKYTAGDLYVHFGRGDNS